MKKKVIAMTVAVVMLLGCLYTVPALASDENGFEVTGVDCAYNGQGHSVSVSVTGDHHNLEISYKGPNDNHFKGSNPSFVNAGTYAVDVKFTWEEWQTGGRNGGHWEGRTTTHSANVVIKPVNITLTADSRTITYGDPKPTDFTYSCSDGFVSPDGLSGTPAISCAYNERDNAGKYDIVINPASVSVTQNYNLKIVNGELTVNPKAVTVTADDKSVVHGNPAPNYTADIVGLLSGDSLGELVFDCEYTTESPVGTYPINVDAEYSGNYAVTFNPGELTVIGRTFNVTFASHGGSAVASQTVTEGDKVTEPAAPTRSGYRFDGWYHDGQQWNFDADTVTSDITLHAGWTKLYKVMFDSHGGSSVSSQYLAYGEKAAEPDDPTRTGYAFDGWYYYGQEWNFDTNTVTSDVTLYAHWTKLYTVSFDSNGGTSVASQSVREGGKAAQPDDPTRAGYAFDGWYYYCGGSNQKDWNFDTNTVTSDIMLHARWIKLYTVTFDSEHGTPVASQTVKSGGKVTEPDDPTRTGYQFGGWYCDGQEWNFDTNTVTKDITLCAHWTKLYTVTFDSEHGSLVASQIVLDGGKATEPDDPTRTGYQFDGWYYGNMKWNFDAYTVTKNLTLHAHWIKLYTVMFDSNGGSPVASQIVLDGGKATEPDAPTKIGYKFDGWYYSVCGHLKEWNFDINKVCSNVTLFAMWTPISYTVTYNKTTGDGGVTADSLHVYDVEANLTDNGYFKDGYTFEGWSKTSDGTTVDYADEDTVKNLTDVDGDVLELYAVWKIKTYSVSFYQQDGTTQIGSTQTVDWNTAAVLETAPVIEGYAFDKWILTGDDDTQSDSLTNVKENIKAVASYVRIPYIVTFLDDKGQVIGTETVLYGDAAKAPAAPAKEGYTFIGWDKDFSKITGALVVTAQYKINTYTVIFADYNGTVLSTQTVNYGSAAVAPANPARSGYTFTSWDKDYSKIVSDLTVTAQYKVNVSSDDEDIPGTYDSGSQPFPWLWIAVAAVLIGAIVTIVVSQTKRRKKTGDAI